MSDRLDKDLSGHIRKVFDAYEEPYDPVNWQRLRRRRRGRVVKLYLKRAAAAASVAVLLTAGILLWNMQSPANEGLLSGNVPETGASPSDTRGNRDVSGEPVIPGGEASAGREAAGQENDTSVSSEGATPAPSEGERLASSDGPTPVPSEGARLAADPSGLAGNDLSAPLQPGASPGEMISVGEKVVSAAAEGETSPEETTGNLARTIPAEKRLERADPIRPSGEEIAAADRETTSGEKQVPAGIQPSVPVSKGIMADNKGDNGNAYPAYEETDNSKEREGRFSVGFVTTSLMNYADGNTGNEVHFGAGITSGWKLNDRLSVHSGVILAENSLSLDRSNSSVQASTYAMDRAENTELSAVGKNSIVQNVSPNSMDVNLLVMDIPLNVTYRVGMGKTDLLVTGGFSSFAYLDQEYSYHNTVQLYTNASVDAPEPVIRNEKAFSHFDLARQLNLAVGTEVPLGKGSVLIVEPYVKYPLGELTSERIRFGSAGMNLRLSFGSK